MIKKLTLLSLIGISIFGCKDEINIIEDPPTPNHNLQIDGEVQFSGEISGSASDNRLNTKIWVENIGNDTVRIETGACAFNVVAYNTNSRPVWYSRMPNHNVCTDELLVYTITPNETKELVDQMYINGQDWYWDIPAGEWDFVIEGRTEKGELISFSA